MTASISNNRLDQIDYTHKLISSASTVESGDDTVKNFENDRVDFSPEAVSLSQSFKISSDFNEADTNNNYINTNQNYEKKHHLTESNASNIIYKNDIFGNTFADYSKTDFKNSIQEFTVYLPYADRASSKDPVATSQLEAEPATKNNLELHQNNAARENLDAMSKKLNEIILPERIGQREDENAAQNRSRRNGYQQYSRADWNSHSANTLNFII